MAELLPPQTTAVIIGLIETQFDGAGRIAGVKKQSATGYIAGAASSDATNRLQYTAHGAMSAMKLGNGLWEHVNFNSRLQPTQIGLGTTSATSGTLQLDYGYGTTTNNGNLMSQMITIQVPGQNSLTYSQSYSYDQVNRLLSATETSLGSQTWQQNYGYDVYGNRWVSSGYLPNSALTPQSLSAFNAANNRLTTALGFNYDAVGNLTSDPTTAINAMVYDAENRQTSYTKAGVTTNYSYDGDGRRVKKVDSTGTTVFVYNAASQLVAEYSDAGGSGTATMSYLTTDHLGSTRVVTDGTGAVKARHDYVPFGEEIGSNTGGRDGVTGYAAVDSTRQRFTSKERDTESGLDYFGARYYSSAQGRFINPDEFTGGPDDLYYFADDASDNPTFYADIFDPQTLNKYQYCLNNPLRYVDPDGHKNPTTTVALREGVKAGTTATVATGSPLIGVAAAGIAITYVAVDQTVGWDKVWEKVQEYAAHIPEDPQAYSSRAILQIGKDSPTAHQANAQDNSANGQEGTLDKAQSGGEAQFSSGGASSGGGRNSRKVNQKRQQSAQEKLSDLRTQRDQLKSKPNKTPADKAELQRIERAINKELDRAKKSETHDRKKKGS
jgi:RHS repeat-associated protein